MPVAPPSSWLQGPALDMVAAGRSEESKGKAGTPPEVSETVPISNWGAPGASDTMHQPVMHGVPVRPAFMSSLLPEIQMRQQLIQQQNLYFSLLLASQQQQQQQLQQLGLYSSLDTNLLAYNGLSLPSGATVPTALSIHGDLPTLLNFQLQEEATKALINVEPLQTPSLASVKDLKALGNDSERNETSAKGNGNTAVGLSKVRNLNETKKEEKGNAREAETTRKRRREDLDPQVSKANAGSLPQPLSCNSLSSICNQDSNNKKLVTKPRARLKGQCSMPGCQTRDKGGGFCAKHGGGRPCKYAGCTKIVAGAPFCTPHGGRRKKLCLSIGCVKGDQGGGFCAAHGGGRRCAVQGCERRDIGKGRCWSHGGGRRCAFVNCKRCPIQKSVYCKLHGTQLANPQ